jgi:putative sterol carrier protein
MADGQSIKAEGGMSFDELVEAVKTRADKLKELNHTVLFDLGDDGKILVDATGGDVKVVANPDSDDAEATLALSAANMEKLIDGDLNPMVAFTMGRLKVFGSKGIAMKLASLLDS